MKRTLGLLTAVSLAIVVTQLRGDDPQTPAELGAARLAEKTEAEFGTDPPTATEQAAIKIAFLKLGTGTLHEKLGAALLVAKGELEGLEAANNHPLHNSVYETADLQRYSLRNRFTSIDPQLIIPGREVYIGECETELYVLDWILDRAMTSIQQANISIANARIWYDYSVACYAGVHGPPSLTTVLGWEALETSYEAMYLYIDFRRHLSSGLSAAEDTAEKVEELLVLLEEEAEEPNP